PSSNLHRFSSLYDFAERIDLRICNKRVFEALLYAGAFDGLGGHRAQFAAALDGAIQHASLLQDEASTGQGSLFGDAGPAAAADAMQPSLPNVPAMTEHERLTKEKETIGFYISGHPLEPFRAECELLATLPVASLGTWSEQPATLAVGVTAIKRQISKKSGNEFARLTVEDFSGSGEVLVFPEAWAAIHDRVQVDVPVQIKGGYSKRDQGTESATFIVESITRLAELRTQGQISVSLDLTESVSLPALVMRDVRAVVDAHPGAAPLEVCWNGADGSRARLRSASLKLSPASAALLELRALLGPEHVHLVRGN
ncbi:MAG: OB-fold nucleic acid binding domain-containing protein, partial [Polyangiaceae bacterium]